MNYITDNLAYSIQLNESDIATFYSKFNEPQIHNYPYPYLNALREHGNGIHIVENLRNRGITRIITRYNDISELIKNPHVERPIRVAAEQIQKLKETDLISYVAQNALFFFSGPDHKRMRGLINKAFTPKIVEGLRPRIQDICATLIKEINGDDFDLVTSFGFPLPVMVIMDLLGVPRQDVEKVRLWTERLVQPFIGVQLDPSELPSIKKSIRNTLEYFLELFEEKRKYPGNDLISNLVQVEIEGEKLTDDELFGTSILILIAGHETTTNAIGMSILHLLREPDIATKLKSGKIDISSAIEELLRYEPPFSFANRVIHQEFEYQGITFEKDTNVNFIYGSGNRDPRVYSNPDLLNLSRQEAKHLSFGQNTHYCLGAPLARVELGIAITTVLPFLDNYQPEGENIKFKSLGLIRGLESFPFTRVD